MKLIIGSHVSFKSDTQLIGSVKEALSYNANTFMFYTGAPQNTNRAPINNNCTKEALELMKENNINIEDVIVHAPYIVNPCNPEKTDFSISFLKQEIERVESLNVSKIVLHPGSHVGLGEDIAIDNLIKVLNSVITSSTRVTILLETMAGKGSEIGINFNQLKKVLDNVNYKEKIGVCLDTCHLNDAGYDMSNFNKYLDEFDNIIGINKIGCIHINDSKNEKGSHKDRHENIGLGTIGFNNLIDIIYNERLENIPKILETPYIGNDDLDKERLYPPYKYEIEMIRNKKFNENLLKDIRNYYK